MEAEKVKVSERFFISVLVLYVKANDLLLSFKLLVYCFTNEKSNLICCTSFTAQLQIILKF